jgi:hypothetical protein
VSFETTQINALVSAGQSAFHSAHSTTCAETVRVANMPAHCQAENTTQPTADEEAIQPTRKEAE